MLNILHVVGARPNLPKVAPVWAAFAAAGTSQGIVDTGQHYDDALYGALWREFALPDPVARLAVGSGTHAVQTARLLERLESVFVRERPAWVVVYGDVNSTMAAALVAAKLGIRVAHVEAGLRSDDWTMPEEINRIVTDRLATLLLAPSRDAVERLLAEGEPCRDIAFVGNVMVDSLLRMRDRAAATGTRARVCEGRYGLVTLHRPSNVDVPERLEAIVDALDGVAAELPVIFPAHPRTLERLRLLPRPVPARVRVMPPFSYLEMLDVLDGAAVVMTDSGGVQEETTALGIPCLTIRPNTERPVTITHGTNRLVPDVAALPDLVRAAPSGRQSRRPEGWDGRAGERAARAILAWDAGEPAG